MNVSQLHERVRLELLRRIERGAITATLLARRSGLQQPHISNFLNRRRRLSIASLDRILDALGLSVAELLPVSGTPAPAGLDMPLVADAVAMDRDRIPAGAVREQIRLPEQIAQRNHALPGLRGRRGDRFLALAVTAEQAAPMQPVLRGGSLVVLDRHAAVPVARPSHRPEIYAVRHRGMIHYAYLTYDHGVLLLRPHAQDSPLVTIVVTPPSTPAEFIVGRVVTLLTPC